jgi:8-oxo-dGTP diphosphatase
MSAPFQIASVFVEDAQGRLVLQLRDDKPAIPHPGHWGPWGGRVEDGETPVEGAAREVREELTLNVQVHELRYFTSVVLETPAREWHVFFWLAGDAVNDAVVTEGQRLGRFFVHEIAAGTLEGRPVHPVLLGLLDDFRVWREEIRE